MVDNDRGMAAEAMQHVGTPFFTTRDRRTGFGVVLARAAFEQYGGTLEYRSAPGQSTTVLGILPRAPRRERSALERGTGNLSCLRQRMPALGGPRHV